MVTSKARDASVWAFWLIAGYLFDCLLFPIGLLLLLLYLTRWTLRLVYGHQRSRAFQQDLEQLLDRYWLKRRSSERVVETTVSPE